jgi:uncharacterized protein
VRYSWDEPKNRSNWQKHGISFDMVAQVFLDPLHISRQNLIVEGEERWQTIGMVNGVLLVLVAHIVGDEKRRRKSFASTQHARSLGRSESNEEANEI